MDVRTICTEIDKLMDYIFKYVWVCYGLSVSVRYAVRTAMDLVRVAELSELSTYNRLSLTFGNKTLVSVYGTGESVYIVSLPQLVEGLREKGFHAKYCTANKRFDRDGENTIRVSVAVLKYQNVLNSFIKIYDECIDKSIHIKGVEKGEWRELDNLLVYE